MGRKLSRVFALLFWLLIPIAHIHAQTQAAMNAQARSDFAQADAQLNKTYEALLTKLPDAESKQKLRETGSRIAMTARSFTFRFSRQLKRSAAVFSSFAMPPRLEGIQVR